MWAGRVDRDSDRVLQDVQKQTQLTTAVGIAVGIVNQHVRLPVEATYFSLLYVQTGTGAPTTAYTTHTAGLFP